MSKITNDGLTHGLAHIMATVGVKGSTGLRSSHIHSCLINSIGFGKRHDTPWEFTSGANLAGKAVPFAIGHEFYLCVSGSY